MSQTTQTTGVTPLTAMQRDVLLSVALASDSHRPMGTEVYAALDDVRGVGPDKNVLYRALDRLAERGLVEKADHPSNGRGNVYTPTDRGMAALSGRLERLQEALS